MKLIHKLFLGYILVVTLIGAFSSFILLRTIEKNSADLSIYREREITSFVQILNVNVMHNDKLKDISFIQELFENTIIKLPHIKRLTLHSLDNISNRYIHIVSTDKDIIGHTSHKEDIEAILNKKTTILYEKGENSKRWIDITYPVINSHNQAIGAIGATVSLDVSDEILKTSINRAKKDALVDIFTAVSIAILFSILFTFIVLKKIISPIEKLKKAFDDFSPKEFSFIKISSKDEIGELSKAFNNMAYELSSLYSSMQEKITIKTAELEQQFLVDTLTNMPNREALFKYMEKNQDYHLAILDVASFKDINDSYGVEVGNKVIKILNKKVSLGLSDTRLIVYRLSGDEVVVLNPLFQTKEEFVTSIKYLIERLEYETIYLKQEDIEINISLHAGISFESDYALEKANLALTNAKKDHLDLMVFDTKLDEKNQQVQNLKMITKIRDAVNNLSFIAYYQPIVNRDGKTIKYEALVRMKDAQDILSPYFFLDIAKKTKYYHHITRAMIFQAFKEFENRTESFSVNIEADDIINEDTRSFIMHNLENFKDPSRVVFEIVESEDIHNLKGIKEFILSIKDMGAKIAIDDFGTGYSNFSYLLDLEPDYIKIDGSLIKDIETNHRSYSIVKTLVNFAHNLDIKVIAEFVHSETVFAICDNLTIDEFQGYYFAEPSAKVK